MIITMLLLALMKYPKEFFEKIVTNFSNQNSLVLNLEYECYSSLQKISEEKECIGFAGRVISLREGDKKKHLIQVKDVWFVDHLAVLLHELGHLLQNNTQEEEDLLNRYDSGEIMSEQEIEKVYKLEVDATIKGGEWFLKTFVLSSEQHTIVSNNLNGLNNYLRTQYKF